MHTALTIVAERGRTPRIRASGGLAARITGRDTVHLISAAATPLGGDHLEIVLRVGPGASLTVRTVAAALALPGAEELVSTARWDIRVDRDAELLLDPEPMVVAADADHRTHTRLELTSSSRVTVRERAQIGRTGEHGGRWSGALHADLDGMPLLRHRLELGAGTVGHDLLDSPMAVQSELVFPDERAAVVERYPAGGSWVRMPLAAGGSLGTRLGRALATVNS
ncbi:ureD urease accessory family protein [Rhodococcus sp. MTM3W5.2]|uniref:urease accessory protein UreD n=1 Tax=Rhodococcus sp. MTM3W5.2 TaxID=1805827 RepID=UPI0009797566|nr:urease accessory protein UreD [Rhodococcus sp. MTM3W5.2]AQA25600.1 ureD urease accessory family protein [Rhodococcus sp. MTM3W5.2]